MNRIVIAVLAGGLLFAGPCAQAKLPPAPPKSPAEQAAAAEKAKEAAAKDAAELAAAMDRAVANYKKNKGMPVEPQAAPAKAANMHKKHK